MSRVALQTWCEMVQFERDRLRQLTRVAGFAG
jgi:hypothetical protein